MIMLPMSYDFCRPSGVIIIISSSRIRLHAGLVPLPIRVAARARAAVVAVLALTALHELSARATVVAHTVLTIRACVQAIGHGLLRRADRDGAWAAIVAVVTRSTALVLGAMAAVVARAIRTKVARVAADDRLLSWVGRRQWWRRRLRWCAVTIRVTVRVA